MKIVIEVDLAKGTGAITEVPDELRKDPILLTSIIQSMAISVLSGFRKEIAEIKSSRIIKPNLKIVPEGARKA